jgi:hypothetical protein
MCVSAAITEASTVQGLPVDAESAGICLAPITAVTDSVFRRQLRQQHCSTGTNITEGRKLAGKREARGSFIYEAVLLVSSFGVPAPNQGERW